MPDPAATINAQFSADPERHVKTYQTSYTLDPTDDRARAPPPPPSARLFAGAKEVAVIDGYDEALKLDRFDRLIDWGWFYFITKPLFLAMDWTYHRVGNFGIAILLITVLIKVSSSRSPTSPTPRWRR